ncbi:MAG TPA: hypothetical protein VFJ82_15835 [Longimicrobium sp.]|nr:hypothetical protein [Longimicrobium sp.]
MQIEFFISELVRFGITTVVGVLGVDTTMKTMPGLLAKAKALEEDGLNAYIWSGGYSLAPTSVMRMVRDGRVVKEESFLRQSDREIHLRGTRNAKDEKGEKKAEDEQG